MAMTIKTADGYQLDKMLASGFSPRECQVLLMRASGLSIKAIAQVLNCSVTNINNRLNNLFYKTGANNSTELITKAMQSGRLRFLSILAALFISVQPPADHQYFARNTRPLRSNTLQARRKEEAIV